MYNVDKGIYPISASAIAIDNNNSKRRAGLPDVIPKAATVDDIKRIIGEFRSGAERAKRAGFDGIQLHCAHGYLLD